MATRKAARRLSRLTRRIPPEWSALTLRSRIFSGKGLAAARELAVAQDHQDPLFEIDELLEELGP